MFSTLLALCEENPLVTSGFPSQWASNVDLWWFLCCKSDSAIEQTIQLPVTWDTIMLIWHNIIRNLNICCEIFFRTSEVASYNNPFLGWGPIFSVSQIFHMIWSTQISALIDIKISSMPVAFILLEPVLLEALNHFRLWDGTGSTNLLLAELRLGNVDMYLDFT